MSYRLIDNDTGKDIIETLDNLREENNQLQSNWNSLREYAKDEFKKYPDGFITSIVEKYNDCFTSDYTDFDKHSIILNILKEKDKVILDKMDELEGGNKDEQ